MIIAHFTRPNRQAARQGQQVFRRAIALREALYPVLLSYVESDRPPPFHLSQLSDEVFRLLGKTRVMASADKSLRWEGPESEVDGPLWPIAWSAFHLMQGSDLNALKQCSKDGCTWIFLDKSRNRTRRWCEMKQCGNVMKSQRYYKKAHCT